MVTKGLPEKCFAYRVANSLSMKAMAQRCRLDAQTIMKCESGGSLNKMSTAKIMRVVYADNEKE